MVEARGVGNTDTRSSTIHLSIILLAVLHFTGRQLLGFSAPRVGAGDASLGAESAGIPAIALGLVCMAGIAGATSARVRNGGRLVESHVPAEEVTGAGQQEPRG